MMTCIKIGMGRGKLHFSCKKNSVRKRSEKRRKQLEESNQRNEISEPDDAFIVSIPLCSLPPEEYVVSILYTTAKTGDIDLLYSCLNQFQVKWILCFCIVLYNLCIQLLPGWTVSRSSNTHLVVYKSESYPPLLLPQVTFCIEVASICTAMSLILSTLFQISSDTLILKHMYRSVTDAVS